MERRSRAGRRPGPTATREAILEAAGKLFADKGYDRATIRGIATEAGVNPALIHHFFGSKEELFVAVMRFPMDPSVDIPRVLDGPAESVGERVTGFYLGIWSDPATREPFIALLRSAMTNERVATMMREFIAAVIVSRISQISEVPALRVEAVMAQLLGVAIARYVLRVEPLASAPQDELQELLAPVVQAVLAP